MKKLVIEDMLRDTDEARLFIEEVKKTSAKNHDKGFLKIPFIENNPTASLLYSHIRKGQITPKSIRQMDTDDLIYIAAHTEPNSEMEPDELARVKANAIRAQYELDRRNRNENLTVTVIVAFIAALLGAGATLLAQLLWFASYFHRFKSSKLVH